MKFNESKIFSDFLRVIVFSILLIGSNADSAYSFLDFSQEKASHEGIAQRPDPNEDRLLPAGPQRPTSLPEEPEPEVAPTEPVLPEQPEPGASDQTKVAVDRIEVTGNTVLDEADIAAITQPLEGKTVTVAELTQAANAITQLYFALGYITSRAVLPEQTIDSGVVQIQISEGSLDDIRVEGLSRLRSRYVTSRLRRGVSTPLNANSLEEQLRLLRFDPLLENIRGRLQPGETAGESILSVEVEEANALSVGASVDNYSSPALGSERLGVSLAYQNLSGWGDTLSTSYYGSTTGGSNVYDLGYRLPVNALDGAFSLRVSMDDFEVTQGAFTGLINGASDRYEISFRQPLVRSLREEFALSLGLSYRDGQTFLESAPINNDRTSVLKFGQDYTRRDSQGVWSLRSQFSLGTGLFGATSQAGDVLDGQFFSWLGQVQRVQSLGRDNLLLVSGDLQLASGGLLSSEQFSIGGGQSLRGYRQNVRSGDNGFRFSVEDRIVLDRDNESGANVIRIAPFFDAGAIWNAGDNPTGDNPNSSTAQKFLAGAGLGFLYDPLDSLSVRLDYAVPLIALDDKGNNAQDEGFYFSVNYHY